MRLKIVKSRVPSCDIPFYSLNLRKDVYISFFSIGEKNLFKL